MSLDKWLGEHNPDDIIDRGEYQKKYTEQYREEHAKDNYRSYIKRSGLRKDVSKSESIMPSYSFTLFAVEISKRLEERGLSLYKVSTHVGQYNLINQLQRSWKESRSIDDTVEAILSQIEENS